MFTCSELHLEGQNLSFAVPSVGASWTGTISSDGATLSGAWTQKSETWFVNFARERFVPATTPSPVDGIWLGSQQITANAFTRIQVVVRSDISGKEYCTMDALDIYTMGLECTDVAFKGNELSFNVPASGEHWIGTLSPDGKTLTGAVKARLVNGNTSEEISSPLNLARQTARTPEKPLPQTTYDPAIPPVQAAEPKSVLDRDLTDALKTGELAPSTGAGVSIAVYEHGVSEIFSYGTARPDSIYEIGSMTKTFTGLLHSQLAVQGTVRLDQPVRELLPPGTVAKPDVPEITLLDLATQRSGLPPMPDNISVANLDDPYADYHSADLFAYLAKHGVTNPSHAISSFGSLGYGLLGVSLASRTGLTYAELLKKEITGPLGMKDTVVSLSPEQQLRFISGHDQFHNPAKP